MTAQPDILSSVLQGVRLTGAVFFDVHGGGTWATAAAGAEIAPRLLPGVQHLVSYHVLVQGSCWVSLQGLPPWQLQAGDIIVFPHGDPHMLASDPALKARPDPSEYARVAGRGLPVNVQLGTPAAGAPVHIVCGFLGCDLRPFNPLIATLPRALHIRDRAGATRGWLTQFVHVAVAESSERRPGSQSVLARLSELLFVEAVRRHLETLPPQATGWLAGLRDEAVGRALAALHGRPRHAWSLDALAREAGLSRSALAERFAALVGVPPMQYLAQWRMQLAAGLLDRGGKVSAVAFEVGYESEAAFSRAFKKLAGRSPAAWRDRHEPPRTARARGRTLSRV